MNPKQQQLEAFYEEKFYKNDVITSLSGYIGELGHQSQKHLDTLVRDIFRI